MLQRPFLGRGKYSLDDGAANFGFGGVFDKDENQFAVRLGGNSVVRTFFKCLDFVCFYNSSRNEMK